MRNATAALFVTVLIFGTAHAQQPQGAAPTTMPIAGIDEAALVQTARASKLIGSKVFNGDTAMGHIEDVLVDFDRSSVAAVILSVGGFLGLGEKLVAVPVNQIKVGKEARFTTDLTKDQLASAPAFDFGKLK
jgi:sporulation protein YlmC with PRC-barrel domain